MQELADKRKAFYRYKTEIQVNNYEPNSSFLEEKKSKTYVKYTKKVSSTTKYNKKTVVNNECEFIDD